jgi:hypothetical protein
VADVTMNAEGARIERRLGRPILARLHAAASAGMAIGAILGSLIVASRTPWAAGLVAALGLAAAGLAYGRAAEGEPGPATVAFPSGVRGLSFSPALIGLGIVIGVSIAAETAALLWSTLLLRAEAPKLAAIAGLGGAFFSACQMTLRFNADVIRLRFSDQRIIVGSFAVATAGFAIVAAGRGFGLSIRRLRPNRDRHRRHRALRLRPRSAPVGRSAGSRPLLRLAVQRADPPAGFAAAGVGAFALDSDAAATKL